MHNTYKLKIWYLLLNIIVALVTLSGLLTLAGVVLFFLVFIVIAFRNGVQQTVISLGMFAGVFLLFGILMALFGIVFPVGNALFSYLRTGAPGVELRLWPFYRLKCAWHQVIGIEQVKILRGLLCLPMLRFTEGQIETWPIRSRGRKSNSRPEIHGGHHATFSENPSGLTFLLVSFLLWSVNDMNLIPVYIFTGWPNGKLQQDLERRLGHIRG